MGGQMELESVPGVGAKTAAALRELDDPEAALRDGDVASLARAPGISEGRAARIARGAIRPNTTTPVGSPRRNEPERSTRMHWPC